MTARKSLYVIGDEYRNLFADLAAIAEENDGQVPEEKLAEFFALEGEMETKVLNIGALIKDEKVFGEAIKAEAEARMKSVQDDLNRAKAHIALADRLKDYLADNVPRTAKYEDTRVKIAWQGNGGSRSVELLPEVKPEELPEKYKRVIVEPDAKAIREALEAEHMAAMELDPDLKSPEASGQPLVLKDDNGKELAIVKPRGVSLRVK